MALVRLWACNHPGDLSEPMVMRLALAATLLTLVLAGCSTAGTPSADPVVDELIGYERTVAARSLIGLDQEFLDWIDQEEPQLGQLPDTHLIAGAALICRSLDRDDAPGPADDLTGDYDRAVARYMQAGGADQHQARVLANAAVGFYCRPHMRVLRGW